MKRIVFLLLVINISVFAFSDKLLMIYVEKNGCGWCKKMDKEIIENPKALKKIHKQYVLKKMLSENGDLPSFINPRYFPTTYILNPEGTKIIEELPGYMEKSRFLDFINEVYNIEFKDDDDDEI
jgi:thioredoxin-related protein